MSLPQAPDDPDALAAEYVLGLTDEEEVAAVERRLGADPAFARLVEEWRMRLQPLDDTADGGPAPTHLWHRIAMSVGASPQPAAEARAPFLTRLWNSLPLWRGIGLAGAATVFALLVAVAGLLVANARKPVLVAVLLTDQNRPAAIVNVYSGGDGRLLPLETIPVPPGKILEVWTLWDRAVGPRSIGRLGEAQAMRLSLENLPLGPDQLFEITVEPEGGSPIGRPTGPILMKGTTARPL